ncbi:DNA replication/repair protein RecF [bacterium]|nr:DNA replication/repair protein RecF [bacterium]
MFLKQISLTNFRNQQEAKFDFKQGINVFIGKNGQGKTNLAEAIHYLCFLKSFRTSSDEFALKKSEKQFQLTGNFNFKDGSESEVILLYTKNEGKLVSQNHKSVAKFSDFIGSHPCVCLSLEDLAISNGSPSERRKFLDVVISQTSKVYLDSLIRYGKVIKQKNKLLENYENQSDLLDTWDEELSVYCFEIIKRRREFLKRIIPNLSYFYKKLSGGKEEVTCVYESSLENTETQADIFNELTRKRKIEVAKKTASFGIHRDDLTFKLNGFNAKGFASQGQHKTLILALKLAEIEFMKSEVGEEPITIFDDVFSELDEQRIGEFFGLLSKETQVFVTTTNLDLFEKEVWKIKF